MSTPTFAPSPAPPEAFQLGVWWWHDGDEVVLWHGVTGRSVRLHRDSLDAVLGRPGDPRLKPLRRRLDAAFLLNTSPRPPWPDLIPVRSRLVLTVPDEAALWLPVPGFRGPGGYGYRAFQLSPGAHRVWAAINDARTVAQVAARAGLPVLDVQALCALLTSPELQALQLRDAPARPRDPSLERLIDIPRPPNARPPHLTGPAGETTLTWYHLHGITDGTTHFDDRETTVAHALAPPHPGLGGRTYGAALGDHLRSTNTLDASTPIVEVGCGTGELARDLRASGHVGPYLRVDLSPELLRTQASNAPDTRGVLADALALPLRDASVRLLISNEVIADLMSVPVEVPAINAEVLIDATSIGDAARFEAHAGVTATATADPASVDAHPRALGVAPAAPANPVAKATASAGPDSLNSQADAAPTPTVDHAILQTDPGTHPPARSPSPIDAPAARALAVARRVGLDLPPGRQLLNLGAWRFVQEIARVLAPGGTAWLSEFGVLEGTPAEAVQLDHPEVAIQFTDLAAVARHAGLIAEICPLAEALGADLTARHLARPSWHALRALARSRDLHLPARAWTPESLRAALPFGVEGLRFTPLSDEGPGPLITRFYALTLRRPEDPGL